MKRIFKINETEVSEQSFFDVLDTLVSYYDNKPSLSGIVFTRDITYYYEYSKLHVCNKLSVKDSIFRELYLEKLNEINDVLGL